MAPPPHTSLTLGPAEWAVLRLGIEDLVSWLEPVGTDDDEYWNAQAELLGAAEGKLVAGGGRADVTPDELDLLADAAGRLVDISEYGVISDLLADDEVLADLGVGPTNFDAVVTALAERLRRAAVLLQGPAGT